MVVRWLFRGRGRRQGFGINALTNVSLCAFIIFIICLYIERNRASVMIISTVRANKRCSRVHVKREVKVMGESKILGHSKGYG